MLPSGEMALAHWFAEAVNAEIQELEKSGGEEKYELSSGVLITNTNPTEAIFEFALIAGGTRIPEDSSGKLKTENAEFAAYIISLVGEKVTLKLSGKNIPLNIYRAELVVDEIGLLRRLYETLENPSENGFVFNRFGALAFHPQNSKKGALEIPLSFLERNFRLTEDKEKHGPIMQACGSEITYLWGPPGTGKTFTIAQIIAVLVERGERVLMVSHTKVAVDEALSQVVEKEGPLFDHPVVTAGQILRIGQLGNKNTRLPTTVLLEEVLKEKSGEIQKHIEKLETELDSQSKQLNLCLKIIAAWDCAEDLFNKQKITNDEIAILNQKREKIKIAFEEAKQLVEKNQVDFDKAEKAFFFRQSKIQKARAILGEALALLETSKQLLAKSVEVISGKQKILSDLGLLIANQNILCQKLPSKLIAENEAAAVKSKTSSIENEIGVLKRELLDLERRLIAEAKAVFCTLTKNYVGESLRNQSFDVVIIDELSMALPPLVFLAACRATARVILVGDFLQLPPIVRGKAEIIKERLAIDTFELAQVSEKGRPNKHCQVLAKLKTQRRMRKQIADVARHLAYQNDLQDHPIVHQRERKAAFDFLPQNPLIIVDTADLHAWSGKQPGSLSRFNFYSATVSIDIAALAATHLGRPGKEVEKSIGIVTPFAAQRRLLRKLIEASELQDWVQVGTVHTFQGGQADLIIFDAVLDTPYWTSRLTNPNNVSEVIRDLNVAITRAKEKFIFVGSSAWLNKHAKDVKSALGRMWDYLKEQADLVPALELVKSNGFFERALDTAKPPSGWTPPEVNGKPKWQKLDETTFFAHFETDLKNAQKSIFAMAPYFGQYRWPQIEPYFKAALERGVEVTLVTSLPSEADNPNYVGQIVKNLRSLGAVVAAASGLHGKDVIIDERILYTGSMNWSSNRGRLEESHRIDNPDYAKACLHVMQARHIRSAIVSDDGRPRLCPFCGQPVRIINQSGRLKPWERQALKIGCTNDKCSGYLRPIDERPPLKQIPVCSIDSKTKYRLVKSGKGQKWVCPKHSSKCPTHKFVPGDKES